MITTAVADVEYVDRGTGEPLLVSHGIFGSCESVLLFADLFGDRRLIAPSRFGYLGSSIPTGATPAEQADAFVALLDALKGDPPGCVVDPFDVVGHRGIIARVRHSRVRATSRWGDALVQLRATTRFGGAVHRSLHR